MVLIVVLDVHFYFFFECFANIMLILCSSKICVWSPTRPHPFHRWFNMLPDFDLMTGVLKILILTFYSNSHQVGLLVGFSFVSFMSTLLSIGSSYRILYMCDVISFFFQQYVYWIFILLSYRYRGRKVKKQTANKQTASVTSLKTPPPPPPHNKRWHDSKKGGSVKCYIKSKKKKKNK